MLPQSSLNRYINMIQAKASPFHDVPASSAPSCSPLLLPRYVDDLTFSLAASSASACSLTGHSSSSTWYAVLDMGTNYCNLRNILDGAG